MKLASIVPVKQIVRTYDGDYAMLLAHMSGYYPLSANKNCYRIMDNSLIELGGAVDINTVYDALNISTKSDSIVWRQTVPDW